MNTFVDVPCDRANPTGRGKTIPANRQVGTRWLHNPQTRKWYMVAVCPYCRGVHAPKDVRSDRLVYPRRSK